MGDGVTDALHGRVTIEVIESRHHRFDGQRHVGAGVSIGNWIDVEAVDHFLVVPQDVPIG